MSDKKDDKKIVLSKPYTFEGETCTEIDLNGLDDLKLKDLTEIEMIYIKRGNNAALTGLTLEYCVIVANRVTNKPLEFFENLPGKDATALKNKVVSFFYD